MYLIFSYTIFSVSIIHSQELPDIEPIEGARVLLNLSDSVTTDHISPAGSIARNSPAARYLAARGYVPYEQCVHQGRGVHVTGVSAAYTFKLNTNILSE
jgi:aconitase A